MKFQVERDKDEPPNQVQNAEGDDDSYRGIEHTLGDFYRLLLWGRAVLHRIGSFMRPSFSIADRRLYLVLGFGKYEG